MKAPRIVQSYWSKAYQNTPNSGWAFRESHYMSWALSCLQLKQFYDEIELVTDSEGADLLINKLHLPYTSCLTILDKLKNENPAIWALGKIAAYEVQQEPFIHVDGDIYIWKPFPKRIEEAGIVAHNSMLLGERMDSVELSTSHASLGELYGMIQVQSLLESMKEIYGWLLLVAILCLIALMLRYSDIRPIKIIEPTYNVIYKFMRHDIIQRLQFRRRKRALQ